MRGRSIVLILLVSFVLVAAAVIGRRSYGYTEARSVTALDRQLSALQAERTRLAGAIRDESGRSKLGPLAEQRLGMKVPADTQVVLIRRHQRVDGPSQ